MPNPQEWLKVTLLFPLYDNDGNPFPTEVWNWCSNEIAKLVNAYTDRGTVRGWWRKRWEVNQEIFMIVKTADELGAVRQFLSHACREFNQEVMYLEYHPVHFEEVR